MICLDAPTIFRLAGFNSDKAQWISGLNNIFYMVSLGANCEETFTRPESDS